MMRGTIVILLASALLAGCNYKKETDIPPPLEVPESFSEGSEAPTQTPEADTLPKSKSESEPIRDVRWWRQMGDPTLTALIEEALRRNQTVRAGWARVQQSQYIANLVRAARMPTIGAVGAFNAARNITPFAETTSLDAQGSIPVAYEVDLFARRAREHQAAKLDAEAARLDQEALAIAISASVAEAWFDSVNARIQNAVVAEQLETDLKFLELVELRYREGLNSAVDVHQQRQRVAGQRALLAVADSLMELTDQRLSVLLGEAPGREFPIDGKTLPEIGPTPGIEVPASFSGRVLTELGANEDRYVLIQHPFYQPDAAANRATKQATIRSVADRGLADTTIATVAQEAGLSQGIVNLHFRSKEGLLTETLRYLADEYRSACQTAAAAGEVSPVDGLLAMVELDFRRNICSRDKLAVWFAFWVVDRMTHSLGNTVREEEILQQASVRQRAWAEAELARDPTLGCLVMGHTHRPMLSEPKLGQQFLNPGAWLDGFRYGIVTPTGAELATWKG